MRSVARALLFFLLAGIFLLMTLGQAAGQQRSQLLSNYHFKLGVSYSTGFINVTRNRDEAEASLVSDSNYSPYVSIGSPPYFLFNSGIALGITSSYSQFSTSQQDFPNQGPERTGDETEGRMLTITPTLSYYLGKQNNTHFLKFAIGAGWGWGRITGGAQFGDTPGAEPPEKFDPVEGTGNAVYFSIEYRLLDLSLAYFAGGPLIETDKFNVQMGDNSAVLSYVFDF